MQNEPALKYDLAQTYFSLGEKHRNEKQYELAIADCDRAIALDPDYANGYYRRGLTYTYLKQFAKAIEDFHRALQGDWNESTLFAEYKRSLARGLILGLGGKLKDGLTELEKAIALEPEEYDAYFWKCMFSAYYYKGQPHKAYTALQEALESGMPLTLLTPLNWLQDDRPDFFNTYAKPLLEREEE